MENAPTAERRQHGTLIPPQIDHAHFRRSWSVVDPLDRMLDKGQITLFERRAAQRFRVLYTRAYAGDRRAQDWNAIRSDRHCRPPMPEPTDRQLAALQALHTIATALGALFPLIVWAIVDELCWAEIARRLAVDRRTAKSWVAAAISGLAAL